MSYKQNTFYTEAVMSNGADPNLVWELCKKHYGEVEGFLEFESPFQLLIAVILSAQTTDAQVNRCTPALFTAFPDAYAMASASEEILQNFVRSTGYYRNKAKNILAAAHYLLSTHEGEVPGTMEELVKIPGVGRKSAGVILHHVYNKPALIVDTHFGRVCKRLGFTASEDPIRIEKDVAKLFPETVWSELSMGLNLHGRRTCQARKPHCSECIFVDICPATLYSAPKVKNSIL